MKFQRFYTYVKGGVWLLKCVCLPLGSLNYKGSETAPLCSLKCYTSYLTTT